MNAYVSIPTKSCVRPSSITTSPESAWQPPSNGSGVNGGGGGGCDGSGVDGGGGDGGDVGRGGVSGGGLGLANVIASEMRNDTRNATRATESSIDSDARNTSRRFRFVSIVAFGTGRDGHRS